MIGFIPEVTMTTPRSARCLFCKISSYTPRPISRRPLSSTASNATRRPFSSTPSTSNRRPVVPSNGEAGKKGLAVRKSKEAGEDEIPLPKAEDFKPYTAEEKEILAQRYTPEQMAAIEAAEEAIDPEDLAAQSSPRFGQMKLNYLEDLAEHRRVLDKPIRAPPENYDPNFRFKDEDEIAEDMAKFVMDLPEDAGPEDWQRFEENLRLTVGKEEAERNPRSSLMPELPKMEDPRYKYDETNEDEADAVDPHLERLMKQTGFDQKYIRSLRIKTLVTHRVTNQTRMGKIQSLYYLTIAGNGKGLLGIGEGKSAEPEDARRQSTYAAIRNMQPIQRYENRTIFGDVQGKVGAVELKLMTRPPGMLFVT